MATNYTVSPGEYLAEYLEDNDLTILEFADILGVKCDVVKGIIKGTTPITKDIAIKLGEATPMAATAWVLHDDHYAARGGYGV